MSPRKPKSLSDTQDEDSPDEDEEDRIRCDRIPGAEEHWAKVDKMPIGGAIPPGWKV